MNFAPKNQAILLVAVIIFSATTQVRADIDMGSDAINNVATISLNTVVSGESCPTNGMVARNTIGAVSRAEYRSSRQ